MFNFEPFNDNKERVENLTQDFIHLRQDFIELQKQLLHFMSTTKRLERKNKRQQWKFYHK